MADRLPWMRGKAYSTLLPDDSSQPVVDRTERDKSQRLLAVQIIQIETGRIRRNYPTDAPEQEAFDRIQQLLTMLLKRYTNEG